MNRNMRTPISIVSNQNVLTQTGLTATEDGRKLESFFLVDSNVMIC